jgi:hypothetical protein
VPDVRAREPVTSPLLDGPALARSLGRPEQTLRAWAGGLITAAARMRTRCGEVIGVSRAARRL